MNTLGLYVHHYLHLAIDAFLLFAYLSGLALLVLLLAQGVSAFL